MAGAVDSFGAGAQWFPDVAALTAALSQALGGGRPGRAPARQGLALQPPRARGERPHRRRHARECPLVLYWLTQQFAGHISGLHVFSYLTFRAILAMVIALALSLLVGPGMIARLSRYQIGQVVRDDGPKTHLPKAGTPTMGGALILVVTLVTHAAVGRACQPVRVDGARGDLRLRPDRLLRRLPEAGGAQPARPGRALEVLLAVGGRPRRGRGALLHRHRAGRDHALPAVREELRRAAVGLRLHHARLSDDRRHEQRGEPDRRPRRPGHHAGGAGERRAGHLRLRQRQRGVRPLPADPGDPRRRRAADLLRGAGRRGTRLPVVQHLSGAGIHGRRRRAGDRRRPRRGRRHRAPGTRGAA